jgi:hypothetical protein
LPFSYAFSDDEIVKLLFGWVLLAPLVLWAQVPYVATQGNTTIYIRDWSSAPPPFLSVYFPAQPEVKGIMLTACTTDAAIRMSAVLKYRDVAGTQAARTDDLGAPANAGWARCSTAVIPVERKSIDSIAVQIIASQAEFLVMQ